MNTILRVVLIILFTIIGFQVGVFLFKSLYQPNWSDFERAFWSLIQFVSAGLFGAIVYKLTESASMTKD